MEPSPCTLSMNLSNLVLNVSVYIGTHNRPNLPYPFCPWTQLLTSFLMYISCWHSQQAYPHTPLLPMNVPKLSLNVSLTSNLTPFTLTLHGVTRSLMHLSYWQLLALATWLESITLPLYVLVVGIYCFPNGSSVARRLFLCYRLGSGRWFGRSCAIKRDEVFGEPRGKSSFCDRLWNGRWLRGRPSMMPRHKLQTGEQDSLLYQV